MTGTAEEPATENVAAATTDDDPFVWLEDVTGEKALTWVKERNVKSQGKLEADPSFAKLRDDLLAILDSKERIPMVGKRGEYFYNFWRDDSNPRGIWRRTTLNEYRQASPRWEVLLDLDALAAKEGENWVWDGAELLRPDYRHALISMSRGGADANVVREFDLTTRQFVDDGFHLAESKGGVSWIDRDHIFVYTDFGPGSLTSSGYPRIAKLWKRGTPLDQAELVYEGQSDDMYIGAMHDDSPGFERNFVQRTIAFYNDELYLRQPDGKLVKIDLPNSANKSVFHDYLAVELREPWTLNDRNYAAGSLLVIKFSKFLDGDRLFDVVFEPTEQTALSSYTFTRDYLLLNILEDVKNRVYVLTPGPQRWRREPLAGVPDFGTVSVGAVDADESNDIFLTVTDYLTPTTLYYGEVGQSLEKLKQLPNFFDAAGLAITQHFTQSADGTRIPYFMVAKKDIALDGTNPTILYGYGGFEISLLPTYSAGVGRAWLTQGGVYVVANIRGGGEYGPRWHQGALKANRLRAYEDFAAVARDLVARRVTSARHLGIQGGSNGGLLMGNMATLYPDLFQAVVCQVPLLDMRRYNKLLAGASWMAEYGDPDKPEEWEFIQKFSPYQNVRAEGKYPAILFTTSTRDDRVHPGHARKMMAKMESFGHNVLYYENIEGGHGGAANNKQAAYMQALAFTFMRQQLFP